MNKIELCEEQALGIAGAKAEFSIQMKEEREKWQVERSSLEAELKVTSEKLEEARIELEQLNNQLKEALASHEVYFICIYSVYTLIFMTV